MTEPPDKPPNALDYATPVAPKPSPLAGVGALFGVIAGLFGAIMLFYGFLGVGWLVREWRKVDGHDIFEVGMFLFIGAISGLVAFRWIRGAFRGRRG